MVRRSQSNCNNMCFQNFYVISLIMLLFVFIVYAMYYFGLINKQNQTQTHNQLFDLYNNTNNNNNTNFGLNLVPIPTSTHSYSLNQNDILLNPYSAPLRDDTYLHSNSMSRNMNYGVPINISTRAVDTNYRQVGILTRNSGDEMILPLMGRPLYTNRDKWQFYTMTNNNIKLPIVNKNKSCTNEYGCDNLYNGDSVYVEGIKDAFKVTTYDNNVMTYLPFV